MSFNQQKISGIQMQNDTLEMISEKEKLKIKALLQSAIPESNRHRHDIFDINQFWRGDASKGLSAPIGWLKDSDEYARFQLVTHGHPSVHGLMGGATGFGKSNLLHVLIHSLCWQYSPDELNLYLLNPMGGTEFRRYTDTNHSNGIWLPHVKCVSASNNSEYALSLLEFLHSERKRRNQIFAKAGNIDKYEDYRMLGVGQEKMPRILVIIDEFQVMFDGSTGEQIADSLTKILKQGRSVGIHMLLATQTLASMHVSGLAGMKDQLQLRISFNESGNEQVIDDAVLAHSISAKKECIINENFGAKGCDSVAEIPRVSFSNNVAETDQGRQHVFNDDDAPVQKDVTKRNNMTVDQEKISRVLTLSDTLETIPTDETLHKIISLLQSAIPERPSCNRRLDGMFAIDQFWRGEASRGLSAPIGWLKDSDEYAQFQLVTQGHSSVHGLMGGATGSGKSNLLHVLIHSLCWQYSPDELNLYLLDFKDGAAFRHYTDTNESNRIWLPHVKSISASNDPEYALSLFEFLNSERKRRNKIFGKAGNIDKYEDYRMLGVGQEKMPRILVIIDEFQVMFDGSTGEQIADNLTKILKQGRSVGIHMLLATQTLASMHVSGLAGMKDQLQLRISLNGSGNEQVIDDAMLAHSIIAKKECIINENFGAKGCDSVAEIPRVSFSNNVGETGQVRQAIFNGDDAPDQQAEFVFQQRVATSGYAAQGCFDDGRELPNLISSEWLSAEIHKHDNDALDNASNSSGILIGLDTAFIRSPVFAEMENYFNGHLLIAWNDGDMDSDGRVTGALAEKSLISTVLNSISASENAEAVYYDPAMEEGSFANMKHISVCDKTTSVAMLAERLQELAASTCPNKFFIVENFNRARIIHPVESQPTLRTPMSFTRPGSTTAPNIMTTGTNNSGEKSPREMFLMAFKDQDQLPFHAVLSVKNFEAARKNILARVREHNLFEGCSQRISINLPPNDLSTFIPLNGLRSKKTDGKIIYTDMNSGNVKFFMPFKQQGELS